MRTELVYKTVEHAMDYLAGQFVKTQMTPDEKLSVLKVMEDWSADQRRHIEADLDGLLQG